MGASQPPSQWGPRPAGFDGSRPPWPVPPIPPKSGCATALGSTAVLVIGLSGVFLLLSGFAFFRQLGLLLVGSAATIGAIAVAAAKASSRQERRRFAHEQERWNAWWSTRPEASISASTDPQQVARLECAKRSGGGTFLGIVPDSREWKTTPRNHGVLILGPTQCGKTTGLIIPMLLTTTGPVISTSTKLDVLHQTHEARARYGRIWLFDPSGTEPAPPGVLELRWSPIWSSRSWDGARTMASAMVEASSTTTSPANVEGGNHWTEKAAQYLAPLLHAAALHPECTVADVRDWVNLGDFDTPAAILHQVAARRESKRSMGAMLGAKQLLGVRSIHARERSSIVSTAARVVDVYNTEAAQARSRNPNFDPIAFVQSEDTVYITASAVHQKLVAPLIVGLLEEVKQAAYAATRDETPSPARRGPVTWLLDEAANIAPIRSLPSLVSEGGGQGLQIVASFQDLSQARRIFGHSEASGLLSNFRTKVIFPGIGDVDTLEAISTMAGEWDRPYAVYGQTIGQTHNFEWHHLGYGGSWSVADNLAVGFRKERQLTAADISNVPFGFALVVQTASWSIVEVAHHWRLPVWSSIRRNCAPPRYVDGHELADRERLSLPSTTELREAYIHARTQVR
jgi:type IV secretion system protein VirD4